MQNKENPRKYVRDYMNDLENHMDEKFGEYKYSPINTYLKHTISDILVELCICHPEAYKSILKNVFEKS